MPTSRLTQHRVDTLKPRRKTCDIRDAEIKGFGVRILPSGRKRYFLHSQIDGNRVWCALGMPRTSPWNVPACRREPCWRRGDTVMSLLPTLAKQSRSRWWPKRSSGVIGDTGSRAHRQSMPGTTGIRYCPGSGADRLPISPDKTFSNGLPRSMQRQWPRTARHRLSR